MSTNDTLRGLLRESYSELLEIKSAIGFRAEMISLIGRIDAALAEPVAGGVVLPEYDDPELHTPNSPNWHSANAYNQALDDVAALNGGAVAGKRSTHTQWWLVELDRYGNPELKDGGHDDQAGANKAFYLYGQLGFDKGEKYAVAKIEMFEPVADSSTVNHEALDTLKGAMTKQGGEDE